MQTTITATFRAAQREYKQALADWDRAYRRFTLNQDDAIRDEAGQAMDAAQVRADAAWKRMQEDKQAFRDAFGE